jgi:ribonuclease PH
MVQAMQWMKEQGMIEEIPVTACVSAISVGIVDGEKLLDLRYAEDSNAKVDMNVIMTDKGEFIEVQGTGEEAPFSKTDLLDLLELAEKGCRELHEMQKAML